jgi:hypothetical protein
MHEAAEHHVIDAASRSDARGMLAVAVVLDSLILPAWQHLALSRIATSPHLSLVAVVRAAPERHAAAGEENRAHTGWLCATLRRVVDRLDARIECPHDALDATDAAPLLATLPTIDASTFERSLAGDGPTPRVDVFVDFSTASGTDVLARFARQGLWRFEQPYSASRDAREAAFWPVYRAWPLTEAQLCEHRPDGSRIMLATTRPATHLLSLKLSRSAVCWRMASLLAHKLRELHTVGLEPDAEVAAEGPAENGAAAAPGKIGAPQLATYVWRNVARRARASAARRLMNEQWILMLRFAQEFSAEHAGFKKLVPPADRFWADPHLVKRDGRFYAFVEECPFATGKGRIVVLPIEADGSCGDAIPVLERDYHLSYPFVFEDGGELYMVPESQAHRTVDLYRCVAFPHRWEIVTTLLNDVAATDSTLLRKDGRWWLFTNVVDVAGASSSEELYLFASDRLIGGQWQAHARNPVISDARRARPAGAIIRCGGRLIRPSQDCSQRYGYAIRLNEIQTLSDESYRETEIGRIEPTWDWRICAVHTIAHVPGLTMIDALQPRLAL